MQGAAAGDTGEAGADGARFHGSLSALGWIALKGSVLMLATLGLYRFWYLTDLRRHYWGETESAGATLEYAGTGRELFIGFLVALIVVLPLNVALFIAALSTGLITEIWGVGAFLVLGFLGQYALFRARRYRLTRTVFRGLRFHQTGSAWGYAVRASLWWAAILATLGLAYPFARASLERYKLGHTWFGDLQARFEGRGRTFFARGIWLWLAGAGPLVAALAFLAATVTWPELASALERVGEEGDLSDLLGREGSAAVGLAFMALVWGAVFTVLAFPLFHGIEFRWWAGGVRFGRLAAVSSLRNRSIYGAWLVYILGLQALAVGLAVAAGVVVAVLAILVTVMGGDIAEWGQEAATWDWLVLGMAIGGYAVAGLGAAAVYQLAVVRRLWLLKWRTLSLAGLDQLESVRARGEASSAFGEGLADALDAGGI